MYANNYVDWQGKEVSSYYGEGQLNITNKAQGQFVIINLLGGDGDADIKRFSINGKNTGGLTDVDVSDTVIFNAVNVTGNINIGEAVSYTHLHRIVLQTGYMNMDNKEQIIEHVVNNTAVPTEDWKR